MEQPLLIGIWPLTLTDEIIAFLKPAADLGGETIQHGPGWTCWTIHDGDELIGAAHCRRTVDHAVEVVLVGGVRSKEWIGRLDELIGAWARDEGALCLRAYGRRGWARVLQGWSASHGHITEYRREL